jgi:hypothetical protein
MITIIFHGAEVFDRGDAAWLLDQLHAERCLVAGIMARQAADESGLPTVYDGRKPSEILAEYLPGQAVLIHRAKTDASAIRFGSLIASNLKNRGLIMIEPGTCRILVWGRMNNGLCRWLSDKTGFQIQTGTMHQDNSPGIRYIGGCLPGEPVFINGIIVGHATDEEAVITIRNGTLKAVSGIVLKEHGVEKLMRFGYPDISTAWCKSGNVRNSPPKKGRRNIFGGKIVVIDHNAFGCYQHLSSDSIGILAIGDDTTSICGHIGCFRGIPILGITDGDIDGIVPEGYAPGSVVLEALNERDDDLGREIAELVPLDPVIWDEWVEMIIGKFGPRIKITHREPEESFEKG